MNEYLVVHYTIDSFGIYYVMPSSLLGGNFRVMVNMFFFLILAMLVGFVVLFLNLGLLLVFVGLTSKKKR